MNDWWDARGNGSSAEYSSMREEKIAYDVWKLLMLMQLCAISRNALMTIFFFSLWFPMFVLSGYVCRFWSCKGARRLLLSKVRILLFFYVSIAIIVSRITTYFRILVNFWFFSGMMIQIPKQKRKSTLIISKKLLTGWAGNPSRYFYFKYGNLYYCCCVFISI